MITIVDIAKESGYSVSTVSRVLNNRKDVSETTKRKIMEIVEAHNFVPNNNAKHLKQGATKNIIMIVKGTSNMLFASIIDIITRVFRIRKLPGAAGLAGSSPGIAGAAFDLNDFRAHIRKNTRANGCRNKVCQFHDFDSGKRLIHPVSPFLNFVLDFH